MANWLVESDTDCKHSLVLSSEILSGKEITAVISQKLVKIRWNESLRLLLVKDSSSKNQVAQVFSVKSLHCYKGQTSKVAIEILQYQGLYKGSIHLDNPAIKARVTTSSQRELTLSAPMTGRVLKILKKGGSVKPGETLFIIDAMKMENQIQAPQQAVIDKLFVGEGAAVKAGDPLLRFL